MYIKELTVRWASLHFAWVADDAKRIVVVRVCVSVCVSGRGRMPIHYCTDPGVTCGSGRRCPLVVHYWADLQSVHGVRSYGNITRTPVTSTNAKCSQVLCTRSMPIVSISWPLNSACALRQAEVSQRRLSATTVSLPSPWTSGAYTTRCPRPVVHTRDGEHLASPT